MNLGMMRNYGTPNTGIGCLMPAVSPMVITRNRAGYVTDRLRVVSQFVGRPGECLVVIIGLRFSMYILALRGGKCRLVLQ